MCFRSSWSNIYQFLVRLNHVLPIDNVSSEKNVQNVIFKAEMSQFTRFFGVNFQNLVSCLIWPHKHKHPELHTLERTIVPRLVIFRLGTLVPNYICPKLLIKLCNYLLVSYVKNKYPEIYLSLCSKLQIWTSHYYFLVRLRRLVPK